MKFCYSIMKPIRMSQISRRLYLILKYRLPLKYRILFWGRSQIYVGKMALAHAFTHLYSICTPYFFTIKSECLNCEFLLKANHWKTVWNLRFCGHRLIRWFEDNYLLVFWFISVKFKTHGSRKLILSFSWNNFQISRFNWWIELYQAAIAKQQF